MTPDKPKRIESLDVLKGLVMVFMALDHTRDYFHEAAFFFDPTDPEKTNLILFLTRWVTHFCAPTFSFLAGTSAFLVGRKKSMKELSSFLVKRGFWLILIELTIVEIGWSFNLNFDSFGLLVIWSLGVSMIFLAALIHMKLKHILIFSLVMIFGHNLLNLISIEGNFLWSLLHQREFYEFGGIRVRVVYPLIPWIGVMSLGYYVGSFYSREIDPVWRRRTLTRAGLGAIALFVLVRAINLYGNPKHWESYDTMIQTFYSFMDPSKYPPSVTYLLMTLGPAILFLGISEGFRGKLANILKVYGKVPFFYYILHIYIIHAGAMLLAELTGYGWDSMILSAFVCLEPQLEGYGVSLGYVYLVWLAVLAVLYPLCLWYGRYKLGNKEKWWLSYL